jgi:acetolactate synthase-1/2/3 large subunit
MQKSGATIISDAIEAQGVDHVFFMDAILRHTLLDLERRGIRRVLAHSEKAAAYMADGYARATGRVGICMAQSVGAANLAAGLQDAYLDRVPVLAITGRKPDSHQHRNAYQEISHAPLFSAVTKFAAEVRTVRELPRLLGQALRQMQCGTSRPAHLDLDGLKGERIEEAQFDGSEADVAFATPSRPPAMQPAAEALTDAVKLIEAAERPIIVCGVDSHSARDAISLLAETLEIPVATSVGGRSVLPTNHPCHMGVVGTYSAPYANALLAQADLVLYIGCHLGDQVTCDWTVPASGTKIVQVDVDPAEIGRCYPGVTGLSGDLVSICNSLGKRGTPPAGRAEWRRHCIERAATWQATIKDQVAEDTGLISAEQLAVRLGQSLPENALLVADTGFSATWTAQMTDLPHREQRYIRAAGSLGWAFPAAIGAKCGLPNRPVVCFTGDGALYYHIGELETLARLNLPMVTVVNNNSALGQGRRSVKQLYQGRSGRMDDLVGFRDIDFAALAKIFGLESRRVTRASEIVPSVSEAIACGKPALIDVVTDPDSNPQVPWRP